MLGLRYLSDWHTGHRSKSSDIVSRRIDPLANLFNSVAMYSTRSNRLFYLLGRTVIHSILIVKIEACYDSTSAVLHSAAAGHGSEMNAGDRCMCTPRACMKLKLKDIDDQGIARIFSTSGYNYSCRSMASPTLARIHLHIHSIQGLFDSCNEL